MKDSADWEVLRGIGQQGSGSEEKQAAFCLAGAVQGELGVEKAAAEQAPEKKFAASVQCDADTGKIGRKQIASACE